MFKEFFFFEKKLKKKFFLTSFVFENDYKKRNYALSAF